jgi:NAD(P)-dependent dehydrogenase (short-subunit alcohol dehydrogenase family)
MSANLAGQVALVTGAGKRIGRSIALRLAADGADVAVNYLHSHEEAEAVAAEIRAMDRRSLTIHADVSLKTEVDAMFARVEKEFGRLDVLVNNTGMFEAVGFEDISEDQWDRMMAVNLKSQMLCSQAAAPLMRRDKSADRELGVKGRIINIASLGGLLPWPAYTHYCVSKAGVIMLTRCLARALAPKILVNAIAPGTIQFPGEPPDEDYIRRVPLHRTGTGEDIAEAVAFLVRSDFVTGQVIPVDGGRTLV